MTVDIAYEVKGRIWVSGETEADGLPYVDGEAGTIEVERTDLNEIRLVLNVAGGAESESHEEASFYVTDGEAARLAHMLGAVVLTP